MGAIPDRERGYSIDPNAAIVHERYQDHAPLAMRTSALGVTAYAKGRTLVPCSICFPAPKARGGSVAADTPLIVGEQGPGAFVIKEPEGE
jgi:hypothetical protein